MIKAAVAKAKQSRNSPVRPSIRCHGAFNISTVALEPVQTKPVDLPRQRKLGPAIIFFSGMITIQAVRDVLSGLLISCSGDRLPGVGDDFAFVSMDRKVVGL
jgi:hypothetical protein